MASTQDPDKKRHDEILAGIAQQLTTEDPKFVKKFDKPKPSRKQRKVRQDPNTILPTPKDRGLRAWWYRLVQKCELRWDARRAERL